MPTKSQKKKKKNWASNFQTQEQKTRMFNKT